MNIKTAKQQIANAIKCYFTKDDNGDYIIPIERQRPVFLMGPPGIGKTAIMEQIAAEMGVGILSYSMTHHTRQSALGLPYIEHKTYNGKEYAVSEYTMSEIIASVYDLMAETGIREGILFLDEINCVSETLAPVMLQFLQYKVFGRHRVPDGWIIVTAGNPPEYNNSVRDFDIVTWDRLKRIDVEPDYTVWKEYAYNTGVHPAVLTYLEIKKANFYRIETTVDGKTFVTARGWDDLSQMIKLYERNDIKIDEDLIGQYLQNKKITKDFAVYYDLFNKYRSDYQVDKILDGTVDENIKNRAKNAKFDERLSLLGLLIDACSECARAVIDIDSVAREVLNVLKMNKARLLRPDASAQNIMMSEIEKKQELLSNGKKAGSLSKDSIRQIKEVIRLLETMHAGLADKNGADAFKSAKVILDKYVAEMKKEINGASRKMTNALSFCNECFSKGQEVLIIVTEFTSNKYISKFIGKYGLDEYYKHNKDLLIYERNQEIMQELAELDEE